jgi:hypothetical protein
MNQRPADVVTSAKRSDGPSEAGLALDVGRRGQVLAARLKAFSRGQSRVMEQR